MKFLNFVSLSLFAFGLGAQADVSLPLQTLRFQSDTAHCWAYASSHFLEARALMRDSNRVLINIEKDVKYWVDYERMMYIYKTKNDFYLTSYEGGWQIEYWESFLKHGKSIKQITSSSPDVWYKPFENFEEGLGFMPEPRPSPDATLPSWNQVDAKLKGNDLVNEKAAHDYIIDYLNRYYGLPADKTTWGQKNISVADAARYVLGSDYRNNHDVESLVLVKPVEDGNWGWIRYLENRYWGYRYDQAKILSLIETSLNNKWPVTFDNVNHAMTIVAYATKPNGEKYYAVADSAFNMISWYSASTLLNQLNLVTFFKESIPNALPARTQRTVLRLRSTFNKTIDQLDNTIFPPH